MESQYAQTDLYDTDVLIVGAGPVGLMAACELARHGVSCRIIEKETQRSPLLRAVVIQARTLELLALLGLERTFLQKGFISQGINIGCGIPYTRMGLEQAGSSLETLGVARERT